MIIASAKVGNGRYFNLHKLKGSVQGTLSHDSFEEAAERYGGSYCHFWSVSTPSFVGVPVAKMSMNGQYRVRVCENCVLVRHHGEATIIRIKLSDGSGDSNVWINFHVHITINRD